MQDAISLHGLARRTFRDTRVLPLLCDCNPGYSPMEVLSEGSLVWLPSRAEARRFAARMGFHLGFQPDVGGDTGARRAWKTLQEGRPSVAGSSRAPPESGHGPVPAPGAERASLLAFARSFLGWIAPTARPEGIRSLCRAFARHPGAMARVLLLCGVPAPELALLGQRCRAAHEKVSRAEAWALEEPATRELHLQGLDGQERARMASLMAATRADLERFDDAHAELLGLTESIAALRLALMRFEWFWSQILPRLEHLDERTPSAPDAPADQLAERVGGGRLVRIWREVGPLLAGRHAGTRIGGLGGLVCATGDESAHANAPGATPTGRLGPLDLWAASARQAKVRHLHAHVPERWTATLLSLRSAWVPTTMSRGRGLWARQEEAERVLFAPREFHPAPRDIRQKLEHLWGQPRQGAFAHVPSRARRQGAFALAEAWHRPFRGSARGVSALGTALLMMAVAADAELGPELEEPLRRAKVQEAVLRYGISTLSLTALRVAGA